MNEDERALPRVLLVSNMWPSDENPVYGGFVARQVAALRSLGVPVTVVANTDARTGAARSIAKYHSLARRARRAAREGDFDIVVGHYLYPTAGMARSAARIAGAKLVLVVHGTDARSVMRRDPYAAASRRALATADLVVTVSDALAAQLRASPGLPEGARTVTIHMGIDEATFAPDGSARTALGVASDERVVLFVGNLVEVKGLDVLQEAFSTLVRAGSADRLVIVGGGVLRDTLVAWADSDPVVAGRVTLTGRLSAAEVARWMAAADVFVLPSRHEGLGLVLLEAMACGTPCVASAVGGVPEVLDVSTGVLVAPGDALALGAAIERVLAAGKESYREACLRSAAGQGSVAQAEALLAEVQRVAATG